MGGRRSPKHRYCPLFGMLHARWLFLLLTVVWVLADEQVTPTQAGCEPGKLSVAELLRGMERHVASNRVAMSRHEQALIQSFLTPDTVMLEYGSGFSTMWYSQFVKKYYSVEHNQDWGKAVTDLLANSTETASKVTYRLVPEQPYSPAFRKYVEMPSSFNESRFDVVLVDGRQRVDCAKFVFKFVDERSVVLLHDYWQRPHYHSVQRFYNVIASIHMGQSLVVLRKKGNVTLDAN